MIPRNRRLAGRAPWLERVPQILESEAAQRASIPRNHAIALKRSPISPGNISRPRLVGEPRMAVLIAAGE